MYISKSFLSLPASILHFSCSLALYPFPLFISTFFFYASHFSPVLHLSPSIIFCLLLNLPLPLSRSLALYNHIYLISLPLAFSYLILFTYCAIFLGLTLISLLRALQLSHSLSVSVSLHLSFFTCNLLQRSLYFIFISIAFLLRNICLYLTFLLSISSYPGSISY